MRKVSKIIIYMLIVGMLSCILPTGAFAYEQVEITSGANFSVDCVLKAGHSISLISDRQDRTGMATEQTDTTWDFPVHLEISFRDRLAEVSELRLGSMYGKYMGISVFDFEYLDGEEWKTIQSGIEIPWQYTTSDYEMLSFHFHEKITANRFRMKITKAMRREFRLDEIQLYGQMKGLADPVDIESSKPMYISVATGMQVQFPSEAEIHTTDGETVGLAVTWPETSFEEAGTYLIEGTIPYYAHKPVAVVDAYDINRSVSEYDGNWAKELVEKSVRSGISNGIAFEPARVLDRSDCAKLIFRKVFKDFKNVNIPEDIKPCDVFCNFYATVADKGCFDLTGGFAKDKKVTRIEMITAAVMATGGELTEDVGCPFTDVSGLPENQLTALKIGLQNNLIQPGESFRPNDGVTLGEALIMLEGASGGGISIEFADNGQLVRNPNMGLFSYYYDNDPNNYDVAYGADELFLDVPEVSVVFMRFAWAFLEPKNGEYDFSMIDSVINRFAKTGRQIAFRISTAETGFPYATPSWVFDEGCKYYRWDDSGINENGANLMADFNDPIYLKYQRRFTEELARRYDGNPNIAFVEIGNVGVWGEGHTYTSGIIYNLETAKECIDMYADNFKETDIHSNNLIQGYPQLEDYCIERGIGWRNDSFYVNGPSLYTYQNQYEKYWENLTVSVEPQHWDRLVGWNPDECIEAFDTIHPTYFGLHGYLGNIMLSDGDFVKEAALKLGYRFVPETVEMTDKVNAHGYIDVNVLWKNNGVAPSYKAYYPCLTLKNKNGSIETVMVDGDFSMTDVRPGSSLLEQNSFRLNAIVPGGEYDAYLSVGTLDGTPVIEMPIDGNDGEKRYYIGKVNIRPDYEIEAVQVTGTNKLNITLSVYDDVPGEYKYFAATLSMHDPEKSIRKVNGEVSISLNDHQEKILKAMNEKTTVTFETKAITPGGELLEGIKGRELTVKMQIYNDGIAKGDNVYRLVGRDDQFTPIGKAVFDEKGNMTFTPIQ